MSAVKPPQVYSKSLNASTWPVLLGLGVYFFILGPNLRIYVYLLYIDMMKVASQQTYHLEYVSFSSFRQSAVE